MSLSLTNESKNTLTLTGETKGTEETWDTIDGTWDDNKRSTWDKQRLVLAEESKNNLTLSNESKN